MMDATKGMRLEEALRGPDRALQTLIDASLAIVLLGTDGNVRLWNPAAGQTFGWTEQEVLGRPIPIVPEKERGEFEARVREGMAGQVRTGLPLRRLRKDGSCVDVRLWTAHLRDTEGEVTGLLGIFADVTGLQVTRRIKAAGLNTRVILMSFHGEEAYRTASLDSGADAFFPKEELAGKLSSTIRQIMAGDRKG